MKKLIGMALFLMAAAGFAAADGVKWNAANGFAGWGDPANLEMRQENGLLVLDVNGRDSGIRNMSVDIAPEDFGMLEVDYRATGLPTQNHGEFYYADAKTGFSDARVWRMWNIDVSGNWQTLRVDGRKFPADPLKTIRRITKLRLDMVNEFPGRIEIKEIRLLPPPKPVYVWNAANGFVGWGHPVRLKMERKDGLLILDITGPDSCIANFDVMIPTDKFDALEVDYRATGLPTQNHGEFYYAVERQSITPKQVWRMWNLDVSGKWKTLRIEAANFSPQTWLDCKQVSRLRLDLVNEFPGRIEIKEIRFMPKMPPLADSTGVRESRKIPQVPNEVPPLRPRINDVGRPYYTCYMVTSKADVPQNMPPRGRRFGFRRDFTLEAVPVKARIHIAADDAFTSKFNGSFLADAGKWYAPDIKDVDPGRFVVGNNRLEGIYWNHGGPGGVYFQLEMLMPDQTVRRIVSDELTLLTPTGHNDDWTGPDETAKWEAGIPQTMPPAVPWVRMLPFQPLRSTEAKLLRNKFAADAESGRSYVWELDFSGLSAKGDDRVSLFLESLSGRELLKKQLTAGEVAVADGKWRIKVDMPKFLPDCGMRLRLLSADVSLPEVHKEFSYRNRREKGADFQARVRDGEVFLNGKRVIPFLGHGLGHNQKDAALPQFHHAGVELRSVVMNSAAGQDIWWVGPDEYDFNSLDGDINNLLSVDENVGVIVFVSTTPPNWWGKLHPDEIAKRSDGTPILAEESKVSFASEKYRADAAKALGALIRHIQNAPYSDRIAGYVVMGGVTAEWFAWEPFAPDKFNDYSRPATERFNRYLREYAPDLAPGVPSPEERSAATLGFFIDPAANRRTLLYNRFMSEMIRECIEHLVGETRRLAGEEKLIGIYYGYTLTCANMMNMYTGSHGALKQILANPDLDLIFCPMSYIERCVGDCGEDGTPFATIRAAGKMPVVEDDIRTHLAGRPLPQHQTPDTWTTAQVIRRSLGRNLSRNQMAEFFAITTGTEFASEAVQEDFRAFRRAASFIVDRNIGSRPEIAVVVSTGGYDYLARHNENSLIWHWEYGSGTAKPLFVPHVCRALTGELIAFQRTILSKIGAPVDYLLAEDLDRVANRPYKLWIFLNQFETTPEFETVLRKIRARKCTCLFMYAPGIFRNERIDLANMEQLTGIKLRVKEGSGMTRVNFPEKRAPETARIRYRGMGSNNFLPLLFEAVSGRPLAFYPDGKVGVAAARMGTSKSVFCGVPKLSSDFLRSLAADAGVWIYSDDEDVLFANDAFLTIHAASSGRKTLRFRKPVDIVDVFTGRRLASRVRQYSFDANILETRVFYYGDAADDFQKTVRQNRRSPMELK